jgi:UDP-hydrolysing UDP-N-acetyl-D-glucosamine 2-epimerase
LLAPVMRAIARRRRLRLRTIVTGAHLVSGTWRDVRDAGFDIDAKVPMQRRGQTGYAADVAALGRGVAGLGRVFATVRPDVVLVLGDRIEALAAALAGSVGGYRVGHLHGGDRAEGVADEAMRHAISKLAHLHFAATALSRKRLLRMGESPAYVFNVGSPAADELADVQSAAEGPDVIVMQHPIGAAHEQERRWAAATLRAAQRATSGDASRLLVMAPNRDPGCEGIRAAMRQMKVTPCEHLPRQRFVSLLKSAKVIVGNSSAGLIEAAILKVPCVNIGPRQAGRQKPGNVIDCDYGEAAVRKAMARAMKLDLARLRHPYGDGRTGERVADLLADLNWRRAPARKKNAY